MRLEGAVLIYAYAAIDAAIAVHFLRASRVCWFPTPLFGLHASLVGYHLYTAYIGPSPFLVQAFLNRAFEAELFYVSACAAYRICVRYEARTRPIKAHR
ncbi:MAG: hypothetical protein AAGC77_03575 [Pseudomonadota bacterium]